LLDSILLEQHGVPSVPIVTTVFQGSVRALAKAQGFTDFPLVVIRHPVAYVGDAELEERAREVLRQAIPALSGGESS
jgi:hypothetical protein